ncbi:phage tail tape measure protein [Oceanobacter sp. 4_MG-2023]|uniref:phage tail tape measure protein n=1 Tax=Oceanobacter sp. 4_MG-2023 TaxID=3062623 RepID=UPI002733FD94|nr:phage tail tape measure protein [Oceanobacter sp. 4_MG-2023]MDP2548902.1 phage tail tape measure protein [Oceanobacter sp. 4_MG-2023]
MSGTTALERLMFTVGLTDTVSRPLQNINRTLGSVRQNATAGFDAIRGGAVGVGAAYIGIKTLMEPVYQMENAIGEVRSLGVAEAELTRLKNTALDFSVQYGESAADFVRSSYDIQSAIGGLTNGELAVFTEASNILAKGTKADAATITGYMGTMYGIFQQQAAAMGKSEWVEQLTGQTAAAVKMFKTTGSEMSAAFTSVGANAQAAGIQLHEQMAILGTLQSTMSGSEAGTKYKSFLAGVGAAQKSLGMKFTDSAGRMLPMLDILNALKSRFGETLDVAESDALKTAFGSDEAVSLIKQLMGNTDGLNASITKLGRNTGMDNARDMAAAMVDPWEQFQAVTEGLRIAFGTALLPVINDTLASLTDGLQTIMGWTREFPHLTKWIGLATLSVILLGGAVGLMSIIIGISRAAWAGLLIMWAFGKIIILGVIRALIYFRKALILLRTTMLAFIITMGVITSPFWAAVIVISIIIAAVVAAIYLLGDWLGWWEKLGAWFKNTEWGSGFLKWIENLSDSIKGLWKDFKELIGLDFSLSDLNPFSASGIDFSWNDLNPFSGGEEITAMGIGKIKAIADLPDISGLSTPTSNTPSTRESIAEILKGSGSSGGNHWGGVTINADNGMTPADLEQWSMLQGG